MAKRFFIIDGLGQIFRSYYAPFRPLNAPSGEPTKAVYVFTNMLLQLIRQQKPEYLAVAMEGGDEEVFRRDIDPQYKANREPPPEDLAPQIERILQIVASQGIPVLSVPGFEADDLMATVCRRLAGQDVEVILVSKDKDLDQLVSDRVRLFDPGKGAFTGSAELREEKGYGPEQAVEVQTLSGDTTDNIPGVKGVGPKKAAALIAKYGSAATVVKHAGELTPAMQKNVQAFASQIDVTRQLVTLRRDVPMDFDLEACRWQGVDATALQPIFTELGFRRLLDQMPAEPPADSQAPLLDPQTAPADSLLPLAASHTPRMGAKPQAESAKPQADFAGPQADFAGPQACFPKPQADFAKPQAGFAEPQAAGRRYELIDDDGKLESFLAELRPQRVFAFDTETTSLNPARARLAGMSFSWQAHRGFYLPILGVGRCLPLEPTLDALRPILADPNVRKVGQNLKYDLGVLAHHGVAVKGIAFDTMVASFVLNPTRPSHGMDALARELLGIEPIPISDLIGKGKNQIGFDSVETARACEYAAEDADVTWQLYEVLGGQLAGSDLEPLFRDTEMPLVEVLAAMETEGVRLDPDVLAQMSNQLADRLAELTRQIHKQVGHEFNIDSTKQLAAVLFDELRLPVIRKTKTGKSTDAETLETLAWQTDNPVPKLVREYRELTKLKGTYVDTLPEMICERTGRIHASFHQTSAVTGRLSSSDPNLQNIPIRTELGRQIRKAFVPRDADHVLLTADYSQVELRVLAHFCQDATLIAAFAEDRDIHAFVASQVFGVPLDEVTKEQRSRAKAVNFGIIYGQGAYGLARTTGMPVGEAQRFIDMYFMRYPGIRMFFDKVIADARQVGYVQTILGRRRPIADIGSRNRNLRAQAERFAVNSVIQGSAADLIKRAMINIHRRILDEARPSRMLIQVHDELVFDVPRSAIGAEADFIRREMATALPLDVPIKVDIAWGDNWLEGK